MRRIVCITALIPVLLLVGCSADDDDVAFEASAWEAELLEHREQKDQEFRTSGSSPMAGTQYLKSEPTDRVWLTREQKAFALTYTEPVEAVLSLDRSNGAWRWKAEEEGVVGAALEDPATFRVGGLELNFYPGDERVTFIVFDPERSEMQAFEHLLYFAPDRKYVVDARLVRFPVPGEVEMLTSRNLIKTFYRYAKIRFELEGQERQLTAFKSSLTGDGLFVPFRDATSGHETYGAGRFLQIDDPDGDRFVLDFNRCFNPLCNYSPAYNCTIPPAENHLDVPVRAGEKTYPH